MPGKVMEQPRLPHDEGHPGAEDVARLERELEQTRQQLQAARDEIARLAAGGDRELRPRRMLVQETSHRLQNLLTTVGILASQTLVRARSLAEFAPVFKGRIDALARTHALLAEAEWGAVALREVLAGALGPGVGEPTAGPGRVVLDGPAVWLRPRPALAIGMIAHELTANAARHGALSVPRGWVSIVWALTMRPGSGHSLVLRWREQGGPAVLSPPRAKGFGLELIEREVRHGLHGTQETEFAPEGLRLTVELPATPELLVANGMDPGEPEHGVRS
jgi:two-component sensor histidine kinase